MFQKSYLLCACSQHRISNLCVFCSSIGIRSVLIFTHLWTWFRRLASFYGISKISNWWCLVCLHSWYSRRKHHGVCFSHRPVASAFLMAQFLIVLAGVPHSFCISGFQLGSTTAPASSNGLHLHAFADPGRAPLDSIPVLLALAVDIVTIEHTASTCQAILDDSVQSIHPVTKKLDPFPWCDQLFCSIFAHFAPVFMVDFEYWVGRPFQVVLSSCSWNFDGRRSLLATGYTFQRQFPWMDS